MEIAFIFVIMTLTGTGIFLILRPRMFAVIAGILLLSHAANLIILTMGRLRMDAPPILKAGRGVAGDYTDPLAQAFILTAIVIGFAITSLLLVVAYRAGEETGTDQVDGKGRGGRSS